jgi:hypothetical protein
MAGHQVHRETMLIWQNWKKHSFTVAQYLLPIVRQSRDRVAANDVLMMRSQSKQAQKPPRTE